MLEERERMAYEMHDTLSQSFAGIGFQLKAIREGMPDGLPRLHQQLDLASDLVRQSHEETRRSIAVLRPEQPGSEGLVAALCESARRLVEGGVVEIDASCSGDVSRTSLLVIDTLYHVGQEALANAVRHGQPTRLEIRLLFEQGMVDLRIRDNGVGFTTGDDLPGFGIRGMRKRAAAIGAMLEVRSRPGIGTEVSIRSGLEGPRLGPARPKFSVHHRWRQFRHVARSGSVNSNSDRG